MPNENGLQTSGMNGFHNDLQNVGPVARDRKRGLVRRALAWVDSQIFVYNVTFGLYMLDWWERALFNFLVLLLVWFLFHNISEFLDGFHLQSGKFALTWR